VTTPYGVFLVYDAVLPPESPEASAAYLAYWRDFESGRVYVYGRLLFEGVDVGHALLNLEADLQIDPGVITGTAPFLEEAAAAAQPEGDDATLWHLATWATVLHIMGFDENTADGGAAAAEDIEPERDLIEPCDWMLLAPPPIPPLHPPKSIGEMVETVALALPCGPVDPPPGPPRNCPGDKDCDGIPNGSDPDVDGDAIPNGEDPDVDGDGLPNGSDPDVDGDGLPNGSDPEGDIDGDGNPDGSDPDVDGDGLPNGSDPDVDGDGLPNGSDPDVDGDGIPNGQDGDIDGDGVGNGSDDDADGDGLGNDEDGDDDGDGVDDGPDPQPGGCSPCPGACCNTASGACNLKLATACTGTDEEYVGDNTTCNPSPCCAQGTNNLFPPGYANIYPVERSWEWGECDWGGADTERIEPGDVFISATCRGTKWYAVLTGLNGQYSVDARLLPAQTEVTGPPSGNTTEGNYCDQVTELQALGFCPGVWYMLDAVWAHENVHVAHLEPALEGIAPDVERYVEALYVDHKPGMTRNQAIAQIRDPLNSPAFAQAVARAFGDWGDRWNLLWANDHDPGGPCDQAEHAVVDPMINWICTWSDAACWAPCLMCPPRPTGRCCAPETGVCNVKTRCDCEEGGGQYRAGTTCGPPNPCRGACCLPGEQYPCEEMTDSRCVGVYGGTYEGEGTTCTPTNPCVPPGSW
jgi:hypothetical protein